MGLALSFQTKCVTTTESTKEKITMWPFGPGLVCGWREAHGDFVSFRRYVSSRELPRLENSGRQTSPAKPTEPRHEISDPSTTQTRHGLQNTRAHTHTKAPQLGRTRQRDPSETHLDVGRHNTDG